MNEIDIRIKIRPPRKSDTLTLLVKAFSRAHKILSTKKSNLIGREGGMVTDGEKGPWILRWDVKR